MCEKNVDSLVVDTGYNMCKAGFTGDNCPSPQGVRLVTNWDDMEKVHVTRKISSAVLEYFPPFFSFNFLNSRSGITHSTMNSVLLLRSILCS